MTSRTTVARITLASLALATRLFVAPAATAQQLAAVTAAPGHREGASGSAGDESSRSEARVLVAKCTTGQTIAVDGRLDESTWSQATLATGFIQQWPDPDVAPTQRTEARVLYDDQAIFVGMRMYDTHPDSIAATLARRDYTGYSDWAQVVIDSYHDKRTAFRFGLNPAGVKKDVFHYNDTQEDLGWDAVWEGAAHIDSLGWTAEFRVPVSQLRFSTARGGEQSWGINFLRDIARRGERSNWSPIPADFSAFVSRFGTLSGLTDLASPRRLEVQPYSLGRLTRAPTAAGDPFHTRSALFGTAGADVKYGLTSDLTLTATLNPDFGQIEGDSATVNLSAFELFFPEKRPFFLEGSDIFNFNIAFPWGMRAGYWFGFDRPFHSRRVGRKPQGEVPDEAEFSDVPDASTILGAIKLSGKTHGGWSLGLVDAVTSAERAQWAYADRALHSETVEPLTNYAVVRAIKDFRQGQSAVGGIFTAAGRRIDDSSITFLRSSAYVAGVDVRHRFGDGGSYELSAAALGSYVTGDTAAISRTQRSAAHLFQRPDAKHLSYDPTRSWLAGLAADARIAKIGGLWRWGLQGHAITPGFEMNDVGYMRSTDWLMQASYVGYEQYKPGKLVRSWNVYVNERLGWSTGGEHLATIFGANGWVELNSLWGANWGFDQALQSLSASKLRGGPAIINPPVTVGWFSIYSDRRRAAGGQLDGEAWMEPASGGHGLRLAPTLNLRATNSLELSLGPSVAWDHDDWQFVDTVTAADRTHYVFGRIDQTTVSLITRLSYTFTPNLSLQFYGAPFVSAGRFSRLKEVTSPRAARYEDRFHNFSESELTYDAAAEQYTVHRAGAAGSDYSFDDPAFNDRQFRSNAVLRWEYRPGSTLFVVWNQKRKDSDLNGHFDLRRNTNQLFSANATNELIFKVSYWLGL